MPEIDALIYLDTDTLFLSPVEDLWKHFYDFNTTQMAALALENEDPLISWYSRFAKHPYYGKLGKYFIRSSKISIYYQIT